MNKKFRNSILTSFLFGAPIGFLIIMTIILIPTLYMGEGLTSMSIILGYGFQTYALIIGIIIALWFGGKLAYQNIRKGKSLISTSIKYSTLVNLLIWTIFCLIIGKSTGDDYFIITLPAIIAFLVSTIITMFTLGIVISYIIKRINQSE